MAPPWKEESHATRIPRPAAEHFFQVQDPRVDRTKLHLLLDIIFIAICAVICGANDWVEIQAFGKAKRKWLKRFLRLPHGIPSHDTFGQRLCALGPRAIPKGFLRLGAVSDRISPTGRSWPSMARPYAARCRWLGKGAIHMISAWATANRLVLGQVKGDEKSNEITAIPALLQVLELSGCIVTMDAMGCCQKDIAQTNVERGGDFVLDDFRGRLSGLYAPSPRLEKLAHAGGDANRTAHGTTGER